ncbi:PKD-like family lipoprotein [Mucilaginibacter paludis]|uniref:PKD-like family protein n=1 Tax=Mucilaginibacter paludis DSM 18603 TaxID=714943 RepID=H1Y091_9SPHI|nr:PKD-like family lipoprotein [Mucilaginibacter paludis]EHQ28140.1 hypothetical protein Mucpa_4049 [Mucilaginibacter paludis DSM 18603]
MKKIFYIGFCISMFALLSSCSKDKGNYDYTALDAVTIDVSSLATAYTRLRFDTLKLQPVVKYKGQVVNPTNPQFKELKFTWEMYTSQSSAPSLNAKDTIGNAIALNSVMKEPEASWIVLFTVTNTNTGVKAFAKFSVAITPSLAEGWMVLYEKNGNTDVGLIVNNEISKTAITTEKVILDLYANSNGVPISGTPGSIIYTVANFPSSYQIYIQSSGDVVSVNPGTFQKVYDFGTIFWTPPAVRAPQMVKATERRKEFIINNNKLHVNDYTIIGAGRRAFGDALSGTYGTLAPWIAATTSAAFDAILYDQTNMKFMKVVSYGTAVIPIATSQTAAAAFDCNNVGMTFLMSDLGWNYWEDMVMKDAAGKYWMLTVDFKDGEIGTIGKGKYDMSACPEISQINSITAGYSGQVFYYSSGTNMYQFNYTAGITTKLWTPPANETITNITLQKYYNTSAPLGVLQNPKNISKILYIATYNAATQIGTVYQMQVDPTSGAIISGTEKKYTGFGKIKAMAWKPYIIT